MVPLDRKILILKRVCPLSREYDGALSAGLLWSNFGVLESGRKNLATYKKTLARRRHMMKILRCLGEKAA